MFVPPHSIELNAALDAIRKGSLASTHESERLEFKQAAKDTGETYRIAADASVCFANHRGGEIVIGIDEKLRGDRAFVGTEMEVADLRQRLFELTDPPVPIDLTELDLNGVRLIVISVSETRQIYADRKGRATQRRGTQCVSLRPEDAARLRDEKLGLDWSRDLCSWAGVEDVRSEGLSIARRRLSNYDDFRRELALASTADLLAGLALVDQEGRLRNAGAVLLCSPPNAIAPSWVTFLSRRTPGSEPVFNRDLGGSLLEAFEEVERLVAERSDSTPILARGGQQLELRDFPELAVREALSNAVLHRDLRMRGPVRVDHSPEVLVILSPGPLVHGVSAENILRHPPQPRNAALSGAGHQLGLAEEIGAGVDRMYRAMLSTGKDVPSIESAPAHVRVGLVGGAPDTQVARFVATLPDAEQRNVETMIVLNYLRERRVVHADDLTDWLVRPAEEVQALLARLASDRVALLDPTRETARLRRPKYRLRSEPLRQLGTAVRYQRRTADETDRGILELVSSYGSIRNDVVRTLLDVNVERASAILRDLVDRGLLVRTSEARRGPSVEYGPGPQFPVTRRTTKRRKN